MKWQEFEQQKAIKHKADLTVDDVLLLDNGDHFDNADKVFVRVVCDGYCGKDEFWGYEEATGRRRGWSDNCLFKIVGKIIKQ